MRGLARQGANWIIDNCFAQHPGFSISSRANFVVGDFDGDGNTELVVWRPSTGEWLLMDSLDGQIQKTQWGQGATFRCRAITTGTA